MGDLVLDEIEFSVEIGANGEFKLLGAGISANAGSSLTHLAPEELARPHSGCRNVKM